ncbi:EpsG family protein [Marinomonas posidonica]|uniref:EpsG family protein n=1 Tax=Marinomonas posidonica (strain CECT 7376 / NCIMB 14433 / IVIA-Po-181) TaxID=491952 RepID=F6CZQ1_MARPP|nr:EpsG family protein [Marinomonas posidonica]AEF53562.1 hypothetical protein Mar181_0501 [Marinomonas posidonica IVIA-Po-181]
MAFIFSLFSYLYMFFAVYLYSLNRINKLLFIFFVCCFSSVFSAYLSHDSSAYHNIYADYSGTGFGSVLNEMLGYELFFLMLSKIASPFNVFFLFFIYAFLSFSIKLALIERVSRMPVLSLSLFFAFFFLYLDGTVIRVSLGIAVAYWGIYLLSKNHFIGFFTVILLSTLLFHYSLIVLLIMPFFRSHISILFIIALTFFFLALFFLGHGILGFLLVVTQHLDSSFIGVNKLVSYVKYSQMSHPYSIVFGTLFFASLVGYFLFKKKLSEFELISFNMLFLSFLCLVALYESQALQNRFSEIFRYSLVFVAPIFYETLTRFSVKPRLALGIYCVFLSGYFFYYYYFKGIISDRNLGLLHTYFF